MIGPIGLVSNWRNMICMLLKPSIRLAEMNSRSRSDFTSASTMRAISIQLKTAMMIITGLGLIKAASANSNRTATSCPSGSAPE